MSLHKSNTAWSLMGTAIFFSSLQLRLAEPYHVVQWKLPTYTTWYGRCHLVSGGPGYVWLAELYNVVPLESSAAQKHGNWLNVASFFYIMQMPICYVVCLIIANTWIYISLYLRNTVILENKKTVWIFSHQLVNTCDLHLFRLLKCAICRINPSKDAVGWSVWNVF